MITIWQFKINGTIVEEPTGWDSVAITLQRDPVFQGLENVFSDNITFPSGGVGSPLIKAVYESAGIDAVLNFEVNYSCDGGLTYISFLTGILNCFFYSIINNEVTIKIEPSGFHRTVKNRLDTPINLNSNTSIDGLPMSVINPFDLGLHSKEILQASELGASDILTFSDTASVSNMEGGISIAMIYEVLANELPDTTGYSFFYSVGVIDADHPSTLFTASETGIYDFNYDIRGVFDNLYNAARSFNLSLAYRINASAFTIHSYGSVSAGPNNHITQTLNEQNILHLSLNAGDKISFYLAITGYSGTTTSQLNTLSLTLNKGSFIKISKGVIKDPSFCKAFLIHEVFAKISESITGIQDSFRSDFLGRTNSSPHTYTVDGCGAWTAITNGLNIRKMLDKGGNLFPIITTFNDLFSSCDAEWNLGMRIERDNTGKEFIRVEPKEYFYNAKATLAAISVSDLKKYPAQDLIFNTYQVGYEKWNLNITGSNAIDEFNSDRNYSLPVKLANKALKTTSKYIGSGYLIEQTRRIQYLTNPTNDFETDNDLFFICTNRASVTSSLYTTPPVSTTYAAGTVSERDENFTGITNVLSPTTCYNYRISPVRMAINWYKYLASSIFKIPTAAIKFISGTGNYQEGDMMINDCIVSATVIQNENLLASNIANSQSQPIYLPEYLEFTYPLSYDNFLLILSNSQKAIAVSCGSSEYLGFIISLKYGPTANGGEGSFKLLAGQCTPGDFNDDFNKDFYIGNC